MRHALTGYSTSQSPKSRRFSYNTPNGEHIFSSGARPSQHAYGPSSSSQKLGTYPFMFRASNVLTVVVDCHSGYAIEDIHVLFEGSLLKQSLKDNKYLFHIYHNRAEAAPSTHDRAETGQQHVAKEKESEGSLSKASEERVDRI